jgi:hypothetical protein
MGKSSIGPEWTDVVMFMSALDTLHDCRTVLSITAGLNGKNGSMDINLTSTFPVLDGSSLPREVVSQSEWPCPDCSSLAMHVYGGCYKHDWAISQAYTQKSVAEQ